MWTAASAVTTAAVFSSCSSRSSGLWNTWPVARSESEVGSTLGKLYYLVGASSNGANLHQLLAAMRVVTLGLLPIGEVVIVNDNPRKVF